MLQFSDLENTAFVLKEQEVDILNVAGFLFVS